MKFGEQLKSEELEVMRRAQNIVFVTGAGMSQESGIPTFRGNDGLWRNYDPMKLATIDAFWNDPKLVWEWYNERRQGMLAAEPNAGHYAVAKFEEYVDVTVLTQNIDGLHQRAKSSHVLELHGNIIRTRCTECDFADKQAKISSIPPMCKCGAILRPDVVWFGEELPQDVWQDAMISACKCDVMIVVGTSLAVSPANTLPIYAQQNGATVIEVNPEETDMSEDIDYTIRDTAASCLPGLVDTFGKLRSRF